MQRVERTVILGATILAVCAGCDQTGASVGSSTPAESATTSGASTTSSTTTPATASTTTAPTTSTTSATPQGTTSAAAVATPQPTSSATTTASTTTTATSHASTATTSQAATPATSATTPSDTATKEAAAASTRINDSDPTIVYSRGNKKTQDWEYFQPAPEDSGKDEHSSQLVRSGGTIKGAGVVINFNGTGITWIGKKGPQYGIASYSLDGGPAKTIDNYSSTATNQSPVVTVSGLSSESHVLSITLLDQKNAASKGYWQTIDGFNLNGSPLATAQATVAGYGSSDLKFTGKWTGGKVSDDSDLSGGHYWSNSAQASLSWTFVGSLIEVFGRPDYEDGYMDVYIDNGSEPVASINGHWGSTDDDALNAYMLFAKKLAPGQHTIKLVVTGKHDQTARDNYVQIDQLVAFQ